MLDQASSAAFSARLDAVAKETEALLDTLLSATPLPGEIARPHVGVIERRADVFVCTP